MRRYSITEEQLAKLVECDEHRDRLAIMIHILTTQGPLVPVQELRDAANHAWGSPVTEHSTEPRAAE